MIQSLQSLRGIFAIIIFFHHFNFLRGEGGIFAAGGDAGVTFFFILSGFVLSCGYSKRIDSICWNKQIYLNFIWKRISKLMPLHILCLLWAVVLLRFNLTIVDLFNLFLLQAWIPDSHWYFSGNAVGWCLSDFVFFYIIFPFICYKIKDLRIQILIIGYFIFYIFFIIPLIPPHLIDGLIYINPLSRLSDFTLGILLYQYYKIENGKNLKPLEYPKLFQVLTILIFSFSVYLWYIFPERYRLNILWWPSICLIIYIFANDTKGKILNNRILVGFGDMSFSFYLIHVLYIRSYDILIDKLGIDLNPFLRLFLILSSLLILSYFVKSYFEDPIDNFLKKFIKKIVNYYFNLKY